jgi:cyclopropane-fatty-acyl-phospholipid synthase
MLARGICNCKQMQRTAAGKHGPYFDLCDYRDIPPDGSYDAITSVEMIEAVTVRYFDVFARRVADALKPGGCLVLQAIIASPWNNPAGRKREVELGSTFVTTHIFPGQQIPTIDWIHEAFRAAGLSLEFSETNGRDYAKTLRAWRHNLDRNREGLDPRAVRTYRYYFAWCEAGFDEELLHSMRFVFRKPLLDEEPLS